VSGGAECVSEIRKVKFNIVDIQIGQNTNTESSAVLQLFTKAQADMHDCIDKVNEICEEFKITVSMESS
jgi:ACT domain-containing protein